MAGAAAGNCDNNACNVPHGNYLTAADKIAGLKAAQ